MQHFTSDQWNSWSRWPRARFMACLSGYKPGMLVGTVNADGQPNLALFQNIVHLGAQPPIIGLINRPREATPHTLANIEATGRFTLSAVTEAMIAQAHATSAKYEAGVSEFEVTGLQPFWPEGGGPPAVAESPLMLSLRLEEIVPIRQNGTFLIIGAVTDVWLAEGLQREDGSLNLAAANVASTSGLEHWAVPEKVIHMGHASVVQNP